MDIVTGQKCGCHLRSGPLKESPNKRGVIPHSSQVFSQSHFNSGTVKNSALAQLELLIDLFSTIHDYHLYSQGMLVTGIIGENGIQLKGEKVVIYCGAITI